MNYIKRGVLPVKIRRNWFMEKTKLGISVGLLGAILYILGLINFLGLIVVAGYILLCESNVWLRKAAVKAVVIYVVFYLVSILLGMIGDIFGFFNVFLGWFTAFRLDFPLNIDSLINYIVSFVRSALYLILAFTALHQGTVSMGKLDETIDKNV